MGATSVDPDNVKPLESLFRYAGSDIPGTFLFASQRSLFEQGITSGNSIDLEISGDDYERVKADMSAQVIASRPQNLWRYRELLPLEDDPTDGRNSGFTPLVRADNLARELGIEDLYLKDDSVNRPTLSYKDRVVPVALSRAKELGFTTVGCASTGNLANAVAVGHVTRDCLGGSPCGGDGGDRLGEGVFVDIDASHLGACTGQRLGGRAAQSTSRAGDNANSAVEVGRDSSPVLIHDPSSLSIRYPLPSIH